MRNKIFNILAVRNAKRSIRNYLTYLITLILIVSFMIAFSAMLFSDDIRKICSMGAMLTIMLGFASLIVVLIILWLMNYMTRFMLEKRSCEIGTYLLLGFNRKQICRLFLRENTFIGVIAFLLGIIPGLFFSIY